MNLINRANEYACVAHDSIGQLRKYTGEPYWYHTERVAYLVSLVTMDEVMIAAAHLHDVIEDVVPVNADYTIKKMRKELGDKVIDLVLELTDISTPADGNREARKKIDREHYRNSSPEAQTIKLADLIDNTQSIVDHDVNFAKVYLQEKNLLLGFLAKGDETLFHLATKTLEMGFNRVYLNEKNN